MNTNKNSNSCNNVKRGIAERGIADRGVGLWVKWNGGAGYRSDERKPLLHQMARQEASPGHIFKAFVKAREAGSTRVGVGKRDDAGGERPRIGPVPKRIVKF